jgi:Ca2+-binding EF-hand superfamily protein
MTLTEEERTRLRQVFESFDTDGNGTLSKAELRQVIDLFVTPPESDTRPESDKQFNRVYKAADTNGDGVISLDEFIAAYERVHLGQEEDLLMNFRDYDLDGNGTIEPDELKKACVKMGIVLSQTDIDYLFDRFDKDKNHKIDFVEFKKLMRTFEGY